MSEKTIAHRYCEVLQSPVLICLRLSHFEVCNNMRRNLLQEEFALHTIPDVRNKDMVILVHKRISGELCVLELGTPMDRVFVANPDIVREEFLRLIRPCNTAQVSAGETYLIRSPPQFMGLLDFSGVLPCVLCPHRFAVIDSMS